MEKKFRTLSACLRRGRLSILFALLFIGGCAGSTAGGLKVSRAMILLRTIPPGMDQAVHRRPLRRQGPEQRGPAGRQHLLRPVLSVHPDHLPVPQRGALLSGDQPVGGGVLLQQRGSGPGGRGPRRKLRRVFRPVQAAAVGGHADGAAGDLSHAGGPVPLRLEEGLISCRTNAGRAGLFRCVPRFCYAKA